MAGKAGWFPANHARPAPTSSKNPAGSRRASPSPKGSQKKKSKKKDPFAKHEENIARTSTLSHSNLPTNTDYGTPSSAADQHAQASRAEEDYATHQEPIYYDTPLFAINPTTSEIKSTTSPSPPGKSGNKSPRNGRRHQRPPGLSLLDSTTAIPQRGPAPPHRSPRSSSLLSPSSPTPEGLALPRQQKPRAASSLLSPTDSIPRNARPQSPRSPRSPRSPKSPRKPKVDPFAKHEQKIKEQTKTSSQKETLMMAFVALMKQTNADDVTVERHTSRTLEKQTKAASIVRTDRSSFQRTKGLKGLKGLKDDDGIGLQKADRNHPLEDLLPRAPQDSDSEACTRTNPNEKDSTTVANVATPTPPQSLVSAKSPAAALPSGAAASPSTATRTRRKLPSASPTARSTTAARPRRKLPAPSPSASSAPPSSPSPAKQRRKKKLPSLGTASAKTSPRTATPGMPSQIKRLGRQLPAKLQKATTETLPE